MVPQAWQVKRGSMSDSRASSGHLARVIFRGMAAPEIAAIDQETADTSGAHFPEDNFLARDGGHAALKRGARQTGKPGQRIVIGPFYGGRALTNEERSEALQLTTRALALCPLNGDDT